MRRAAFAVVLLGICRLSLSAEPGQWTPASDSLPVSVKSFTETSVGRFEALAVGSFPIMLFYAGFGFDLAAYVGSGFNSAYAPWPFTRSRAQSPSQAELGARLGTAVALSLGVATLDLFLRPVALERKRRERPDSYFPEPPKDGVEGGESLPASKAPTGSGSSEGTSGPAPSNSSASTTP